MTPPKDYPESVCVVTRRRLLIAIAIADIIGADQSTRFKLDA
jgi:hypothetical protein